MKAISKNFLIFSFFNWWFIYFLVHCALALCCNVLLTAWLRYGRVIYHEVCYYCSELHQVHVWYILLILNSVSYFPELNDTVDFLTFREVSKAFFFFHKIFQHQLGRHENLTEPLGTSIDLIFFYRSLLFW